MSATAQMTPAEFDELEAFLDAQAENDNTPPLDSVHGYFTADLCGPAPRPFDELIDLVLEEAEFASEREAQRARALLGKLWLEIGAALDADALEPLLYTVTDEDEGGAERTLYEGWCLGFLECVEESEGWAAVLDAEASVARPDPERTPVTMALTPIAVLAQHAIREAELELEGDEAPAVPAEMQALLDELTPERTAELVDALGDAVSELHELLAGDRDYNAEKPEPVRVEKIGRNDPCPCGSGRKYKKCHGAAE